MDNTRIPKQQRSVKTKKKIEQAAFRLFSKPCWVQVSLSVAKPVTGLLPSIWPTTLYHLNLVGLNDMRPITGRMTPSVTIGKWI